jgi:hypothetical protein
MRDILRLPLAAVICLAVAGWALAQAVSDEPVETTVKATGSAAGENKNAEDEATKAALRTAVEQACGVFIKAQTKTENYQAVYDKVLANTVGYVKKYDVVGKPVVANGETSVTVKALVSTKKFCEDWASIAHAVNQENNPRVIIAVAETTNWTTSGPAYKADEGGAVQSKIEDFFITKGLTLMDRETSVNVSKRDLLLAVIKDDAKEVAALGARFHADVVITGQASAKYAKEVKVADQRMYQYVATLTLRVIQTDSGRLLASKTYGPETVMLLQESGGEDKALAELAKTSAPKILEAVVEAWQKRANVTRTVALSISGMDFDGWKAFKVVAEKIDGVQALRLRDITEAIANIDVEYKFTPENLADRLTDLKDPKLKITEITANRIKLTVGKSEK